MRWLVVLLSLFSPLLFAADTTELTGLLQDVYAREQAENPPAEGAALDSVLALVKTKQDIQEVFAWTQSLYVEMGNRLPFEVEEGVVESKGAQMRCRLLNWLAEHFTGAIEADPYIGLLVSILTTETHPQVLAVAESVSHDSPYESKIAQGLFQIASSKEASDSAKCKAARFYLKFTPQQDLQNRSMELIRNSPSAAVKTLLVQKTVKRLEDQGRLEFFKKVLEFAPTSGVKNLLVLNAVESLQGLYGESLTPELRSALRHFLRFYPSEELLNRFFELVTCSDRMLHADQITPLDKKPE